jgi:hypothetical protein
MQQSSKPRIEQYEKIELAQASPIMMPGTEIDLSFYSSLLA